jgi:hypothetical protein
MAESSLELRLRRVAHALDGDAPAFDPGSLIVAPPRGRRVRWVAVAVAAALVAGVAAEPAALSALARLLGVTEVEELGPVRPGVVPGILGEPVARDGAQSLVSFRLREVRALGEPAGFHGRRDVGGGMVSVEHANGVLLTQWSADDVDAHVEVAVRGGIVEAVVVGPQTGTWVAGEARGTFTVTGADGKLHRETFAVRDGALAWEDGGVGFLLHGAGSREEAVELASTVR